MATMRQQKQPPSKARETRMTLGAVTRGKFAQPERMVLFGPPGIGKSTFAANMPNPIFLGAEKGTSQLDVSRFPQPESWEDVYDAIRTLITEEHDFKTFVIDTVDWLEPLCHAAVAEAAGKPDIEAIGFGKGYVAALDHWRLLLSRLEILSDKEGMNVVLLGHMHIRSFKNPEGDHYDRYEMKLHSKASSLIQEWADEVLFTNYETFTHKDSNTNRVRGVSTGVRLIHTVRTAAFDAKNRHSLPDTIPLDWEEYSAAKSENAPASAAELKGAINELLAGAPDELSKKVTAAAKSAGSNAEKLSHVLNRLKAKLAEQQGEEE